MFIPNTLIDLGVSINMFKKQIMEILGQSNLRETPRIIHLVDQSTIKLECMIEDVVISIDSWVYPIDFMFM